jgi:hypothetical protein
MFQTKVVERKKTHTHTHTENRAVNEVMWKNTAERGKSQMTIWGLRIACRISTATNTLRLCVTLFGFPLQQRLNERVLASRYFYCYDSVFLLYVYV